ncbi:unnamed protein product [Rhizoctonia solani]|uniref:Major facilitator superfamily (MFS) profile domain-containing protein n=1 Tax=Rhizoctonia solani TaxID=456999 RepID=A0A8H3GVF7_9AGAM|nr:unnamed protein product [Rhizoctonia solani]
MSDEQRPLLESPQDLQNDELADTASSSTLRQNQEEPKITPLPMKQISILLLMQLSEPISYSVIYPFVAQLVNETGVTGGDKSKIGYYAGMIESVFFLTESVITLQYGRISDRIGRRPVLMFGLLGQAVSIFLFGLSKQFWQLVASRSLSGALNGNVGVVKSMVVELTDETNQAQAFAFTPMIWSLGSTLGPLIGGTLSYPAKHLPRMFDTSFWKKYPYFLPCLTAAVYAGCVFMAGALFLKETHNVRAEQYSNSTAEYGATSVQSSAPRRFMSVRSVFTKRARIAITNYAFLAFSDITYLSLLPVMFAVPVKDGGLEFSPRTIGIVLALQGIITSLFQVCFFASLHRRFGNKRVYVTGYICYSFLIVLLPTIHKLALMEMKRTMWATLGLLLALSCPAFMTFSCMAIYVSSSAPSKDSLGTLNGISQTIVSVIRAIGPVTATSLFSLSARKNILEGNFVYAILLVMVFAGVYAGRWLKDERRAYE